MLLAAIEFLAGNVERAVQLGTQTVQLMRGIISTASLATMSKFSFHFARLLDVVATYLIACDRWDAFQDAA
jgi:hypothetical protein